MKNFFTLSILLLSTGSAFSCSCATFHSFCSSHTNHDLTVSGVIVNSFANGVAMEVIEVFNGEESSDTIIVWDLGGPYDQCNDSSSTVTMAEYLGNIGDTIIVSLPRINSLQNDWDVIGDYRVPGYICWEYKLTVIDNIVNGKISGSVFCNFTNDCLETYDYDEFVADFPTNSLSCETWLSTDDLIAEEKLAYYPNPAMDRVTIKVSQPGNITIINSRGQLVDALWVKGNKTEIQTKHLQSGVYFLTFTTNRSVVTRKLVIQN